MQQFGGFDSLWMTKVATSNTYIESKIQGHISYQFCFCINKVIFFMSKCVYIFLGHCLNDQEHERLCELLRKHYITLSQ
jgi:hypothetical protein